MLLLRLYGIGEIRTVSNLAASDVDHISILSPTSFRFMKTVIDIRSTELKGLEAVLQFMTMAELRVAELQFGEGGGVLNGSYFSRVEFTVGV